MRRSGVARLIKAAAKLPAWHQPVRERPGVIVTGSTSGQMTVHAAETAIQQLRQTLGEGFLIEPVVTRGTTAGGQEGPADTP